MTNKPLVSLASNYVMFLPLENGELALFLPILPPLIIYNDSSFQGFVNNFELVDCRVQNIHNYIAGEITIEHSHLQYRFQALKPFIETLRRNGKVIVVPYSQKEGIPEHDVFGATIPVNFSVDNDLKMDNL